MMLTYLIQTSIFCYSKNYGSLTPETRIKDAVNVGDLICLLATFVPLIRRYMPFRSWLRPHLSIRKRTNMLKFYVRGSFGARHLHELKSNK